ncbi:MAG: hypothetical protein LUP97_08830 [Methanoregula sp.]|nr:hypothetical protein [Methanoregula sp.]
MGEKKRKEETRKRWTKVLAVFAGVLFVVLMVVSSLGTGWITGLAGIKDGQAVVIDYTIYGASGEPVVSTNSQLCQEAAAKGGGIILGKQIQVTANMSQGQGIVPVPFYTQSTGWSKEYALFNPEYAAISSGIVGMKLHEKKKILIPSSSSMTQAWSSAQLTRKGVNMTELTIGDKLAMGVSDNPSPLENSTEPTYVRMGEVMKKNPESVELNFGYPSIDVTIVSIGSQ